jgi:hypothetical protein
MTGYSTATKYGRSAKNHVTEINSHRHRGAAGSMGRADAGNAKKCLQIKQETLRFMPLIFYVPTGLLSAR